MKAMFFSSTGEDAEEIVSDGIKGLFDSLEIRATAIPLALDGGLR